MRFSGSIVLVLGLYSGFAQAEPDNLFKRDNDQNVLSDKIWTSTSSGKNFLITPTAIDGVTISASPVTDSATQWVSLDSSGIPYKVTPVKTDGSTVSVSPTPTASDYPDPTGGAPPVLRCMNDRVPSDDTTGYPFCIANGTELVVGETYWITWDPTYWGGNVARVRLQTVQYPMKDNDEVLFNSDYISNNNGFYPWYIKSSYKKGKGFFWLTITPLVTSKSDVEHVGTKSGPLLRIVDSTSDASTKISRVPSDNGVTSSSSHSNSSKVKVIVPAVIVPVVVIALVVVLFFLYFNRAKKQGNDPSIGGFFSSIRMKGSKTIEPVTDAERVAVTTDATSVTSEDLESRLSSVDASTLQTQSISGDPFADNPPESL
ncbi:hypothetical protein FOA43_003531 [Brettanomyces nanus]|uniref:Uncharacterized protein n=1 Tax=Eeniella nana TaxID=13502 RepID=A0A875S770_EENNA|nr:uncharacterized protein FOA43_003531 [Brettanomyces nanus]QPG76145.1 hypothetical protein FOA43_003531 [Brettanomyces nanus]